MEAQPAEKRVGEAGGTATLPQDSSERVEPSRQFYGVYIKDQKAGWAEQRITPLKSGETELWMRVVVRLARGNAKTGLELLHINTYGPGEIGPLRKVFLQQTLPNGDKATYEGELKGSDFEMRVMSGGKTTSHRIQPPLEKAYDSIGTMLAKRLLLLGVGQTVVTHQFDPMTMKSVPIHTTLQGQDVQFVAGAELTMLKVIGVDKTRGLTLENRLSTSGQTLEMTIGPGFRLVMEEKALAQDPGQSVPDLYRLSRVPVDTPIGSAMSVKRLRLKLVGLDSHIELSDARQTADGQFLEVQRRSFTDLPKTILSDTERARWLAVTPFLDHDASIFKTLQERVAEREPLARTHGLSREVHRRIKNTLATAPLTASEILRQGVGDCTEYSRVLTAALRADGIPAREVSGMAYAGDSTGFAFHAWVEAYIGERWVAFDPTWNQYPIDATHVAISRDDPSPIIGLLGGLSVQVVRVER